MFLFQITDLPSYGHAVTQTNRQTDRLLILLE
jgi:hypothetical protein